MADDIFNADYLFSNFGCRNDCESDANSKFKLPQEKKLKEDDYNHEIKSTISDITLQEKYVSELEDQNAKLKCIIKRMIGPQFFNSREEFNLNNDNPTNEDDLNLLEKLSEDVKKKPFAIVLYLNNDVSTAHRKEVDNAMRKISAKQSIQEVLMSQKLQPQMSAVPVKAFTTNSKGRGNNIRSKNGHEQYIVCACQYFKTFFIDRMGAPLLEDNPGGIHVWDVPTYPQIFLKALPIVEESSNIRIRQLKQCFNCGGEHHLGSCPEPKDENRIKRNRAEFSAAKFNSPAGFQTPLLDEIDERFKHFKAGEISVGLEEALGISLKTQLPPYIYKMREIGYPPGWLKPADDGGLKLYGAEGNELEDPGFEEGEIKPIKLPEVVIYAGFNAPTLEGVKDNAEQFGMPPFRPDLVDLDIARKRAQMHGYDPSEPVKKKLKFDVDCSSDMEIGEEDYGEVDECRKPPLSLEESSNNIVNSRLLTDDCESNAKNNRSKETKKLKDKSGGQDKSKRIDEKTYRNWYIHEPLSSIGITYVIFTPPPSCKGEISLLDLPKNANFNIDREPWKTASVSWYDPLYGDLAVPIGTYDNIRTLLKENKTPRRKLII